MHARLLAIFSAVGLFATACAGAPPKPPDDDPYGPLITSCLGGPRPISDTAQGRMVALPAGPAVLGSLEQERAQARRDYGAGGAKMFLREPKVRRAHLHAFRIDRTSVTNEAYFEFVEACGTQPPNRELITADFYATLKRRFNIPFAYAQIDRFLWDDHQPPAGRNKHPIVLVSHDDAGFYCAWRGGRLPTNDEWERAARGQQGRAYPWGDAYDAFRVNDGRRGVLDLAPVGSVPAGATPEGLMDLAGNVFEWTATTAPDDKKLVVVKGNGWNGRPGQGRGAARLLMPRDARNVTLGFRCAAGEAQ